MHTFDPSGVLGKFPRGKLFQASNGKLYGVAGLFFGQDPNGAPSGNASVLFEYDLVFNKYSVIAQLNHPNAGVIEPLPGILMGSTNNGNSFYKYNINTNVFNIVATIPSFRVYGLGGNYTDYFPGANGELMQASDGNLYFTSSVAPNGPPATSIGPQPGGIYKYNMITNTITKLYYFGQNDFGGNFGYFPIQGKLIEGDNGKLYGTTQSGGITYNPNSLCPSGGCGIFYEFDITTSTLSQKYEFDIEILGSAPNQIMKVSDTKIWGTTYSTTASFPVFPYRDGMIYEYDLPSSTVSIKHAINYQTDDFVYNLYGMGLKASDGNYYNKFEYGIYKYNPVTNTINKKISIDSAARILDLIEICRKPSYQEILVNTYTPEVGSTFTYNINNTNATIYVWQKGTTVLPLQTTSILTLTNVTASDTGVYTCTMNNECGTTVTANLTINVINLGTDTIDNYKQQITLYPNPTKGSINLKFPENRGLKGLKYKITNLLGQVIQEKNIGNLQNKTEVPIDTAGFATGVYQVTLTTDKGNWNGKFLKE